MSDLRGLLDLAAGQDPAGVPMDAIRRRGASLVRRRRLGQALAAAALVALAVVAVPRFRTTPVPPATPTVVRTIGDLAPGPHRALVLEQQLDFTVTAAQPWVAAAVTGDRLRLSVPGSRVQVEVAPWTAVHHYTAEGLPLPATTSVPSDLTAWIAERPGLQLLSAPEVTTLAGRPAHRLRITVAQTYQPLHDPNRPGTLGCGQPSDCILLAETPAHRVILYGDAPLTVVVQDDPRPDRLVAVATVPSDEPRGQAVTEALLDSLAAPPR